MLSGCQNALSQNMETERHNICSRLIIKTVHEGDFGGNVIFTKKEKKNCAGSEPPPYINKGKGDTLAQRAVSLLHQGE